MLRPPQGGGKWPAGAFAGNRIPTRGMLALGIGRKPAIKALVHFLVWPRQSSLLLYRATDAWLGESEARDLWREANKKGPGKRAREQLAREAQARLDERREMAFSGIWVQPLAPPSAIAAHPLPAYALEVYEKTAAQNDAVFRVPLIKARALSPKPASPKPASPIGRAALAENMATTASATQAKQLPKGKGTSASPVDVS